jgi:hypothetical protein
MNAAVSPTKLIRWSEAVELCKRLGVGRRQFEAWCMDPPALPDGMWFRRALYGTRFHYNAEALRWLFENMTK